MLVIMEGIYIKTKNPLYKQLTKFWVKVFALTFALDVANGACASFWIWNQLGSIFKVLRRRFWQRFGCRRDFAFF